MRTMVGVAMVVNVMAIVGRVVFRSMNAAVAASRRQLLKACPRRSAFMVWYGTVCYGPMIWYATGWYGFDLWYGTVWYGMVWHGVAWRGVAWRGVA